MAPKTSTASLGITVGQARLGNTGKPRPGLDARLCQALDANRPHAHMNPRLEQGAATCIAGQSAVVSNPIPPLAP